MGPGWRQGSPIAIRELCSLEAERSDAVGLTFVSGVLRAGAVW